MAAESTEAAEDLLMRRRWICCGGQRNQKERVGGNVKYDGVNDWGTADLGIEWVFTELAWRQ